MNTPAHAVLGGLGFTAFLQPSAANIADRQVFVDGVSAPFTVGELVAAADKRGDVTLLFRKGDEYSDVLIAWPSGSSPLARAKDTFPYLPWNVPTQLTQVKVELELVEFN